MRSITFCTILVAAIFLFQCTTPKNTEAIYELDESKSLIFWKGYAKGGYHEGTIGIHGENITVSDGKLISGTFLFPLLSLTNTNLPTIEARQQLVRQLQSSDFFHMVLYPEIEFQINKVEDYLNARGTHLNYLISGDLTVLGNARPVSFPASMSVENNRLTAEGKLVLDLTDWGMTYARDTTRSDRRHVKPNIDLTVKIYARQL